MKILNGVYLSVCVCRDDLSESSDLTIYMDSSTSFHTTATSESGGGGSVVAGGGNGGGAGAGVATTATGPEIVITTSPSLHRNLTNTFSAPPYFPDSSSSTNSTGPNQPKVDQ